MSTNCLTTQSAAPPRPATFVAATGAIAGRGVRKFLRTPQLLIVAVVQGSLFLLIFRYVFGGAITTPGVGYVQFLVPGFIATTGLFFGSGTAVSVAEDQVAGFTDRLRSLPIPRSSVLAARSMGDLILLTLVLAVTTGVGVLVGFRPTGMALEVAGAFALCVASGWAFMWLFILLGLCAADAQTAQGMGMIVFPITFVSSAYVPIASMPGWMQAFAEHQPVTAVVDAVRALSLGGLPGRHTGHLVIVALAWLAAISVAGSMLALARFCRR